MNTRPQDTRLELLEAALLCFSEHGYDGTSLRMIAQQAGRPLSLIGHHFGGKEGLYLEVFRFLTSHAFAPMAADEALVPRNRQDAVRVFREQIHALYAEACSENAERDARKMCGRRLFLSEMRNPRPEILAMLEKQLQPWVDRMKACIQVLRPDLDEAEIIFFGRLIMSQVTSQGLLEGVSSAIWGRHNLNAFRSAELLIEFSLQGLGVSLYSMPKKGTARPL